MQSAECCCFDLLKIFAQTLPFAHRLLHTTHAFTGILLDGRRVGARSVQACGAFALSFIARVDERLEARFAFLDPLTAKSRHIRTRLRADTLERRGFVEERTEFSRTAIDQRIRRALVRATHGLLRVEIARESGFDLALCAHVGIRDALLRRRLARRKR